jgi:hypothetical protein
MKILSINSFHLDFKDAATVAKRTNDISTMIAMIATDFG